MELRQLEYLVAVAEEASFTRAAGRVHISQSGVSAQLRRLALEPSATLVTPIAAPGRPGGVAPTSPPAPPLPAGRVPGPVPSIAGYPVVCLPAGTGIRAALDE